MFYANFYKNKTEKEIVNSLENEGFEPTLFTNEPGYIYSSHRHPETKLLAFLKGSMEVTVTDQRFSCQAGDKLLIPGNTVHSAKVGPNGCQFFWSEKLIR